MPYSRNSPEATAAINTHTTTTSSTNNLEAHGYIVNDPHTWCREINAFAAAEVGFYSVLFISPLGLFISTYISLGFYSVLFISPLGLIEIVTYSNYHIQIYTNYINYTYTVDTRL